jgi:uncharacterized protein YndB with AHSA1/START domain
MATETIQVSCFIPAPPMRVYSAWLSSEEHSRFTGGRATIDDRIGGRFSAWDGYIEGMNRELLEGRRIVQAWRTTEFPSDSPDSVLELNFDAEGDGTHLTMVHSGLPEGQGRGYEQGWHHFYVEPLTRYFKKAAAKSAPRKPGKASRATGSPARAAKVKRAPAKRVSKPKKR